MNLTDLIRMTWQPAAKAVMRRIKAHRLAALERDLDFCRREQCEMRRTEMHLQGEAMFLRLELEGDA